METTWRGQNLKKITLNLISKENLFYKKSLSTPPINSILNVCSYVQGSMLLRRESDMGAVRELKTNGTMLLILQVNWHAQRRGCSPWSSNLLWRLDNFNRTLFPSVFTSSLNLQRCHVSPQHKYSSPNVILPGLTKSCLSLSFYRTWNPFILWNFPSLSLFPSNQVNMQPTSNWYMLYLALN